MMMEDIGCGQKMQFCSESCLRSYKIHLFYSETQIQLKRYSELPMSGVVPIQRKEIISLDKLLTHSTSTPKHASEINKRVPPSGRSSGECSEICKLPKKCQRLKQKVDRSPYHRTSPESRPGTSNNASRIDNNLSNQESVPNDSIKSSNHRNSEPRSIFAILPFIIPVPVLCPIPERSFNCLSRVLANRAASLFPRQQPQRQTLLSDNEEERHNDSRTGLLSNHHHGTNKSSSHDPPQSTRIKFNSEKHHKAGQQVHRDNGTRCTSMVVHHDLQKILATIDDLD